MRRLITLVVVVPIVILVVALSVANRTPVRLSLDPFNAAQPVIAFEVPLFWLLFAAVALGAVLGGTAAWLRQGRWRRATRRLRAEAGRRDRAATPPSVALPPARRDAA